eukprot:COSAG05_NODE_49_length_24373_cov_16.162561_38_plen_57_part_00
MSCGAMGGCAQEWEDRGVEGHFTGPQPWMPIEDSVTAMMAAVVGAKPTEVRISPTK